MQDIHFNVCFQSNLGLTFLLSVTPTAQPSSEPSQSPTESPSQETSYYVAPTNSYPPYILNITDGKQCSDGWNLGTSFANASECAEAALNTSDCTGTGTMYIHIFALSFRNIIALFQIYVLFYSISQRLCGPMAGITHGDAIAVFMHPHTVQTGIGIYINMPTLHHWKFRK